jgi:hypothetical protein
MIFCVLNKIKPHHGKFYATLCLISAVMFWSSDMGDGFIQTGPVDPAPLFLCENKMIFMQEGGDIVRFK